MFLFQIESVQTFLTQKLLVELSEKTQYKIDISKVKISWLDRVSLKDFLVLDTQNDTLLYANDFSINYRLWTLISEGYLHIEEVASTNMKICMMKYDSTSQFNFIEFINSLKSDTTHERRTWIDEIKLTNLTFRLNDNTKIPVNGKVDFAHLDFMIPYLHMGVQQMGTDTIMGTIFQLNGRDQNSGFEVRNLSTIFRLNNQSLSINDLDFRTPTSYLSDNLEFFYNGFDDWSYFVDSVSFTLHLQDSKISRGDLQLLTGGEPLKSDVRIEGVFLGKIGDLKIEDARIGFGTSTFFEGGASCSGLPNTRHTFILADIIKSHLDPEDLKPYLGDIFKNIQRMGRIDFIGSFTGFLNDFVAHGDFYTDKGSIHSDINLKIPEETSMMLYEGNIEFRKVHIGAFLENEIIQEVNLKAHIKGQGIKSNNANFDLKAVMSDSEIKGYVYQTISTDGHFEKNFFQGKIFVDDPNCQIEALAQVDLRSEDEKLDLDFFVEKMFANKLFLTKQPVVVEGHIDLEVNDFDVENFTSSLKIDSSSLNLNGKNILLDSIRFIAFCEDSVRIFRYNMPGFWGELKGKFNISDFIKDAPLIVSRYLSKLRFDNDTTSLEKSSDSNYRFDLHAEINDISPYLDSLRLPIVFLGKTFIEGSFRKNKNINASLYIQADSININNSRLIRPTVEFNVSQNISSDDALTNFIFSSDQLKTKEKPAIQDLLLEGVWSDNNVAFTTVAKQPVTASSLKLKSNLNFSKDSILFKILPSDIRLFDVQWRFNPTNKVVITPQKTSMINFGIYDHDQSIMVEGVYADSGLILFDFFVKKLNINKINLFTEDPINGHLDGKFQIFNTISDASPQFDGGFLLKDLIYDDLLIGDVHGTFSWHPISERIHANVEVERQNFKAIQVKGYYYPFKLSDQLDFNVIFDQADLEISNPFLKKNFSDIDGVANGSLKIMGELASPRIVGNCSIKDGNIIINYLNTHYTFNGNINFNSSSITLSDFNLIDRKGATAIASGTISHRSFSNFVTNLSIRSNNFEFLNTTSADNSLYYGATYGTGTIDITGPLNDLLIKASIRTGADTRFYIPVSESANVKREGYIEFVNLSADTSKITSEKYETSGLTLDFDIEVTPDTYCELIFDPRTGDIIRGRGRGNIALTLDTDSEFSMFGSLEITEGAYNFTIPNFINKEFEVVPDSRITWYGDPYNANLDIEATYLQRASFEELRNLEEQDQTKLSNKTPLLVVLNIDGGMHSPNIGFDIRLQNESDADQNNIPLLAQIRETDEQELRRQVISLLFLRRFSPRQNFVLGGNTSSIGKSVSEYLSSQVSYLINQIDENLEVEVDLSDLNEDAFNTFQLRFAYTFMGGRLKLMRGGSFSISEDQNRDILNDIVGDLSVEYTLTDDGRLRIKVFRNSNSRLQLSNSQQNQEVGISLKFIHSFSDLRDLLILTREKGIREKRERRNQ